MEEITLPSKIEIKAKAGHQAEVIIEPCYPGYGTTLGNALRRILLSSLPGAAVTAVKIKGVQHEFSTIDYVKEDVVEIILNLKLLRLKIFSDEPQLLKLKVKGEKDITAGDFESNSEVEIVNPKLPLVTLTDKNAEFEMEVWVARGRGYVPVEGREKEKMELGMIAIDSIFTPVKNVNFQVENVRVGQMTNYDRLILEISTDGTISPPEALKMSAKILVDHFKLLTVQDKKEEAEAVKEPKEKKKKGRPKKTEKVES